MRHSDFDARQDTQQPEREFEADKVAARIVGTDVMVAGLGETEGWWGERGLDINTGSRGRPTTEQRIQRLLDDQAE
jgi:Zn-dependent protease with chaperone function